MSQGGKISRLLTAPIRTILRKMSSSKGWQEEKERLSKLPSEERRETYFCEKHKIKEVANIPTWHEQFNKNKKSLNEKVSEKDHTQFEEDFPQLSKSNTNSDISKLTSKVSLYVGDITELEIDAIVNAANESLLGGGGVDGAIHRAAGKMLVAECRTLSGCETGEAKITCGYKLPAKYVIHTVGPRGVKPKDLQSCYEKSLNLLAEGNLRTIAFPCISTGIYGYPSEQAASVAIKVAREFLESNFDKIDRIIFTLFLDKDVEIYEKEMQLFFPVSEGKKEGGEEK